MKSILFSWNQDILSTCHVRGTIPDSQSSLVPFLPTTQTAVSSCLATPLRSHALSYFWAFYLLQLLDQKILSPSSLLSPNIIHSCSSFSTSHTHPLLQEAFPDTPPAKLAHVPLLCAPNSLSCPSIMEAVTIVGVTVCLPCLSHWPPPKREGLLVFWTQGKLLLVIFQDNPLHSLGARSSLPGRLPEITEDSQP